MACPVQFKRPCTTIALSILLASLSLASCASDHGYEANEEKLDSFAQYLLVVESTGVNRDVELMPGFSALVEYLRPRIEISGEGDIKNFVVTTDEFHHLYQHPIRFSVEDEKYRSSTDASRDNKFAFRLEYSEVGEDRYDGVNTLKVSTITRGDRAAGEDPRAVPDSAIIIEGIEKLELHIQVIPTWVKQGYRSLDGAWEAADDAGLRALLKLECDGTQAEYDRFCNPRDY